MATDVLFLLDTTSTAKYSNDNNEAFKSITRYVSDVIKQFDVDNLLTRVGVVLYGAGTRTQLEIQLNDYTSERELIEAVHRLTRYFSSFSTRDDSDDRVNHEEVIRAASDQGFHESRGAREGVRKVICNYFISAFIFCVCVCFWFVKISKLDF